jgi:putative hydrolase of HD superfamily
MDRIAELQQFIADFAGILRVPHLADSGRPENDVEHSFGLALTCWFLAPKIAPELDLGQILRYALAHDTVEIHAGDTFTFGPKELLDSKSDREEAAIEQIAKDWPDFPELADYAKGYKDKRDEEAKFVYAVDKLLPVLMIELGEREAFWNRHKITLEMEAAEKEHKVQASSYVAPYYQELVNWLHAHDTLYKPEQ